MTLVAYENWAVNSSGDVVGAAAVEVRLKSDDSLATIYSDASGTALANPFAADGGGKFEFWADPDLYRVLVGPTGTIADIAVPLIESRIGAASNPFASVADLLASNEPSRGVGSKRYAGQWLFEEAPSSASDHHEITSGDVKLYETGIYYTTVERLKDAVSRGVEFPQGYSADAAGAILVFVDDGNTDITGLTGWKIVVDVDNETRLVAIETKTNEDAAAAKEARIAAEAARDATALMASIEGAYADSTLELAIASALAELAVGDTFAATAFGSSVFGIYDIQTGPSERLLANLTTEDGIQDLRDQVSTEVTIGHPEKPIPDSALNGGNATYVDGTPAPFDGMIERMRINSTAGAGTVTISTWTRDAAGLTVQNPDVRTIDVAGGYEEIDLSGLGIQAGHFPGIYSASKLEVSAETADGVGWYAVGGNPSSFTDTSLATSSRLSVSFDISSPNRVDNLEVDIAAKASQTEVDDIKSDIYETKILYVGQKGPIPAGNADLDNSLFSLEQAVAQDGVAKRMSIYTVASGPVRAMVFSLSGSTFTVEKEVTVSAAGGSETFDVDLVVEAGQYLGVQGTNVGLQTGVSDTFGWFAGVGTDSFTDATATRNSRVLVGFEVEYLETSFSGSSRPAAANLPWENMLVVGMGQSLWEGSNGDVTTVAEFDSKGFAAYPATPVSLFDATVANTERAPSRGEWPGLGAAASIRAALLRDNNLSYSDVKSTVVVANNAVGGALLSEIYKGTDPFSSAVAQAGALGGVTGESSGVLAVTFGQGESDSIGGTTPATYLSDLIQLAEDNDADLRAAAGQSKRIPTVVYQLNATGRDIGLMHLQASIDSPLIYCAGPMYWLTYYDTLHIDAASSRLVGALHGEVIKRVAIDGEEWEPLRPIDAKVLGNAITLTFNKSGLVLDSTLMVGQVNSGFVVKNSGGTVQTVSAVDVLNSNQVRLTCATTPASDWAVEYGVPAVGRSDAFIGNMGNLRDNAGAEIIFDGSPLHNWCVMFDWTL